MTHKELAERIKAFVRQKLGDKLTAEHEMDESCDNSTEFLVETEDGSMLTIIVMES